MTLDLSKLADLLRQQAEDFEDADYTAARVLNGFANALETLLVPPDEFYVVHCSKCKHPHAMPLHFRGSVLCEGCDGFLSSHKGGQ